MLQQDLNTTKHHLLSGHWPQAESSARQILATHPTNASAMNFLAIAAFQSGRPLEALDWLQRAIAADPTDPDFFTNIATIYNALNHLPEAVAALHRALAIRPQYPAAWHALGKSLHRIGDAEGAMRALRTAIDQDPNHFDAHTDLGVILAERQHFDEALAHFRRALEIAPNRAEAHNNVANALNSLRQWDQAILSIRRALELSPDLPHAHANLGNAMRGQGRPEESIAAFREALRLSPAMGDAAGNLAVALRDVGRLDEADEAERHALKFRPDHSYAQSNRLYHLYFRQSLDSKAIYQEHAAWNRQFAEPLKKLAAPHTNDRTESRRLRIAYVSADFHRHCQSFFTIPLFSHHDHENFGIFCYSDVLKEDELTPRIRSFADAWQPTLGWSDEKLADQIRKDRIDILLDLTMHMSNNRPLLHARKPAPVQIAWLAYPGTTGMTAIDYRLTDPYLDPPNENDDCYSERSLRLPDTFWCYDPLTSEPAVNPLPALTNGFITFGCLNNFRKITDRTLALWSSVLAAVPNSRLILLSPKGSHRQTVVKKLAVSDHRVEFIEFLPRNRYLQTYHRIDIGLDTLPYNGHTTSLDSYWMGIPVITRLGNTVVGRAGWSQLNNLNLTDLAAHTDSEFTLIAARLAADLPRLANLRSTLRTRMQKSPLMDAPRFAKNIESAYRQTWQTWCRSPAPPIPSDSLSRYSGRGRG
jgi:protein O-GlcNAc transferase